MGGTESIPEFITVLADKQITHGERCILSCVANTESVTASWEKDGYKLVCVEGKHTARKIGTKCVLEIAKVEDKDEGKYTITLSNSSGSASCFALIRVEMKEWRNVKWGDKRMLTSLKTFRISEQVPELRFLVFGPIGAGKSSTINTIRTIFPGRQFVNCLVGQAATSHTLRYESFRFKNEEESFPFAFNDIMGAEKERGVQTEDIIHALKGHMIEGYMFNPHTPLTENSKYYNPNPSLSDEMHCLVYVIPADKISMMDSDFIKKFKSVRAEASKMGMPQVIFMTRVDCACSMTKKNLQNIYKSKKIRDYMVKCSNDLGVPVNCIFPVLNYHEETHINENINCLMLDALTEIIHFANDYVIKRSGSQSSHQKPICE